MKHFMLGLCVALATVTVANAEDVQITSEIPFIEITVGDEIIIIERIQDNENRLNDEFTKTSRACPPFCIQPNQVTKDVMTVAELEVLDFLENDVENGTGILIDARLSSFYVRGTIPGSINIPFNVLDAEDNQYMGQILQALGATDGEQGLDFSNAKDLMLFCNGLWCGQSPRAIRNLLAVGYPADKLFYYRGGMQAWLSVGLNKYIPSP